MHDSLSHVTFSFLLLLVTFCWTHSKIYPGFRIMRKRLFYSNTSLGTIATLVYITTVLQDVLFSMMLLSALLYSCSIFLIQRLRHCNSAFILNICLNIIGASIFHIIYFTMLYFDLPRLYNPRMCNFLHYAYNISSIEIPFSFVAVSVYRFSSIVYHATTFF